MKSKTLSISALVCACSLSLAPLAEAQPANHFDQNSVQATALCDERFPHAADQERNPQKVQKLVENPTFKSLAARIHSTPTNLAHDIALYFTEDEVERLFIAGLENKSWTCQIHAKEQDRPL